MERQRNQDGTYAPTDATAAEQERARFQQELPRVERVSPKGGLLTVELDPLFRDYVEELEFVRRRDHKTVDRNRYALARLTLHLNKLGIAAVDADRKMLKLYFAGLRDELAESTIETELAIVRAAFKYGAEEGDVTAAPVFRFETQNGHVEPKTFSNDELRQIREQVGEDLDAAIFYLLAYTGMRRFEIANLRWEDVDFASRELHVAGKGGKPRRVPIHPHLLKVLQQRRAKYPDSESVLGVGGSTRNINARLGALLKRAGVAGGNRPAHTFRKTVASVLTEEGVAPNDVDKILGWAPTDVKNRYYVRTNPNLRDAILKLYASDPIERPAEKLRAVN